MYNQFIPPDGFRPVSPPSGTPPREDHPPKGRSPLSALLSSLLGKGGSGGGNATGKTGLAGLLDHGDFLLLFILIYLFRESEDDEWLIILALVLLMGL